MRIRDYFYSVHWVRRQWWGHWFQKAPKLGHLACRPRRNRNPMPIISLFFLHSNTFTCPYYLPNHLHSMWYPFLHGIQQLASILRKLLCLKTDKIKVETKAENYKQKQKPSAKCVEVYTAEGFCYDAVWPCPTHLQMTMPSWGGGGVAPLSSSPSGSAPDCFWSLYYVTMLTCKWHRKFACIWRGCPPLRI